MIINNCKSKGLLSAEEYRKKFGNAQFALNTEESVVIKDCKFTAPGYNCLEIGMSKAPKNVLIQGCEFEGKLINNVISIFSNQDNCVVEIKNCVVKDCSNLVRWSNKGNNKGAKIVIEDCVVNGLGEGQFRGLICLQDFTSKTNEEVTANNLFAPNKLEIIIKNTVFNGNLVDKAEVNTADDAQQITLYCDKATVPYVEAPSSDRLPKVTIE